MTDETKVFSEREEIEMLLPWFATGKLSAADTMRVEAYLQRHPEIQEQIALIRAEQAESIEANEALSLPQSLRPEALLARLSVSHRAAGANAAARILDLIKEFFEAPSVRGVRWAAAAAAILIVAQGLIIAGTMLRKDGATYQTASGNARASVDGSFAIVRFADNASIGAITEGLSGLGMQITEGPKPGGLFVVRISAKPVNETEREQKLTALRQLSGLVAFATPSR